jgi:ribonuclease D
MCCGPTLGCPPAEDLRHVKHETISDTKQLESLCARMESAEWIAFDTEFVSEFTYFPDLCLIQVASDNGPLAVIDPKSVTDVTPFWQTLVDGDHETLVHAGREEYRFCQRAVNAAPKHWFDIQLAAGMVGMEYPASYGKLISRLLRKTVQKGETRTDWRRRPLSPAQIDYALQDVIYLRPISDKLQRLLEQRHRVDWLADEVREWMVRVDEAETRERWRRVSGSSNLPPQSLKIVRAIWQWRESEAQRRDCPPKRVLRDDLIVEMARRGKSSEEDILAIRGINRRTLQGHYGDLAQCIADAIQDDRDLPKRARPKLPPQADLLEKFLSAALMMVCRQQSIAPSIVGTAQDIRDLLTFEMGRSHNDPPALATGWRAEIIGNRFAQLLKGQAAIRIVDPNSEAPLSIDAVDSRDKEPRQ